MIVVIGVHPVESGASKSVCQCDCGKTCIVRNDHVKEGRQKSCGCNRGYNLKTHGLSGTKEYCCWENAIQRCCNKNFADFHNYGGRGISIHPEWRRSFESFLQHIGPRPEGTSLDRIDNNGNYAPGNVRWATKKEQCRNMRKNRVFTVNRITACLTELCEAFNADYKRVEARIRNGWDIEKALFEPSHSRKKQVPVS